MISAIKTVRELAIELPNATRVFEKIGIDYCCGGGVALEEACTRAGIPVQDVIDSLQQAELSTQAADFNDWQTKSLTELTSYILERHHVFTREEMDRLDPLLSKVCSVYSQTRPELLQIQSLFQQLKQDLLTHMLKEEQVLFPYVAQLEDASSNGKMLTTPFFGTMRNPVWMMTTEHETAGDVLRSIRYLSSDFKPPAEACVSYQTLYQALEGLERDLHQHIHLENNILFPRAVKLESTL